MAQTHTALGTALSKLDQTDKAISEFKLALQLDPTFVPAEDGLAQALIAQKKYSAAIDYLKTLPASEVLQTDLAIAYARNGNVDQAIHILSELIKQNPSSAQAHANSGNSLRPAEPVPRSGCGIPESIESRSSRSDCPHFLCENPGRPWRVQFSIARNTRLRSSEAR